MTSDRGLHHIPVEVHAKALPTTPGLFGHGEQRSRSRRGQQRPRMNARGQDCRRRAVGLNLGQAQAEAGNHAKAATNLQYAANALDVLAELTPEDDPQRRAIQGIQVGALVLLGDSYLSLEQWEPATAFLDQTVTLSHTLTEQSPGEPHASFALINSLRHKASS